MNHPEQKNRRRKRKGVFPFFSLSLFGFVVFDVSSSGLERTRLPSPRRRGVSPSKQKLCLISATEESEFDVFISLRATERTSRRSRRSSLSTNRLREKKEKKEPGCPDCFWEKAPAGEHFCQKRGDAPFFPSIPAFLLHPAGLIQPGLDPSAPLHPERVGTCSSGIKKINKSCSRIRAKS